MGQNNSLMTKYGPCKNQITTMMELETDIMEEQNINRMRPYINPEYDIDNEIQRKDYFIRFLQKEDICCISLSSPTYYYLCKNPYKKHIVSYEYYTIYSKYHKHCPLCRHPMSNRLYKNSHD